MHTTLDLSQYNDVTAYADAVHRPVVHVDYLPTPQAVARRVREAVDDRHLSMEQLAKDAHVSIQAAYSLRESERGSTCVRCTGYSCACIPGGNGAIVAMSDVLHTWMDD